MTKSRKTAKNPTKTSEAKATTSIMGTVPSRKQKPATPLKAEASERKRDRKASEKTRLPSLLSNLSSPLRLPAGLTHEQWNAIGSKLMSAHEKALINWWVGEWLDYGGGEWGETYIEAMKKTGRAYQLLADYKWVWGVYKSSYRNENLSWTHHRTVASLPSERRQELLTQAEEYDWSVSELKAHVNPSDTEDKLDHYESQSEEGDTNQPDENHVGRFPDVIAAIKGESRPKNDDTRSGSPPEAENEPTKIEEDNSNSKKEPPKEWTEADKKRWRVSMAKHAINTFYSAMGAITANETTIKEIIAYAWRQRADPEIRQWVAGITEYSKTVEEFLKEMKLLDERLRAESTSTARDKAWRDVLEHFAQNSTPADFDDLKQQALDRLLEHGLIEKVHSRPKKTGRKEYRLTDKGKRELAAADDDDDVAARPGHRGQVSTGPEYPRTSYHHCDGRHNSRRPKHHSLAS